MADLSPGALPAFVPALSLSGSLQLAWPPFAAAELHVWILLVAPAALAPADLRPDALLRELIRVPAEAERGGAVVYVPVDRPLGVLLMARDASGAPCPAPSFTVRSGPPVAAVAVQRTRRPPEPPAEHPANQPAVQPTEPPTRPAGTRAGAAIPLVFARGKSPLPDLGTLAKRIAERVTPRVPAPEPTPQCFGAKQRWTLTRLAFPPGRGERRLVLRPTFMDAALIAGWEQAPPADALALPPEADGLVDALTPDEAMAFYVLLEASADGWRVVPLSLLSPPFQEARHPFVLGDAAARLLPLAHQPATSEAHASLISAALAVLAAKDPP